MRRSEEIENLSVDESVGKTGWKDRKSLRILKGRLGGVRRVDCDVESTCQSGGEQSKRMVVL